MGGTPDFKFQFKWWGLVVSDIFDYKRMRHKYNDPNNLNIKIESTNHCYYCYFFSANTGLKHRFAIRNSRLRWKRRRDCGETKWEWIVNKTSYIQLLYLWLVDNTVIGRQNIPHNRSTFFGVLNSGPIQSSPSLGINTIYIPIHQVPTAALKDAAD